MIATPALALPHYFMTGSCGTHGEMVEQVKKVPKKHGKTVLIVDDNPAIRRELKSLFLHDGFAIAGQAGNGKEAIDLAREISPDLIILDLSMPVLNGLDAAPQLRVVAPSSAIILLTMYATDARLRPSPQRAGIDLILSKTETSEQILSQAHALLHMT